MEKPYKGVAAMHRVGGKKRVGDLGVRRSAKGGKRGQLHVRKGGE